MFTWRTIDTKFPPIPVVPVAGIGVGGEREVQKKGGGGQRGKEDCTISAGKRRALVHFLLAVEPGVASGTLAHVAAPVVLFLTFPLVEAGRVGTGQQAVLTVGTLKALGTGAHVATLQILDKWK